METNKTTAAKIQTLRAASANGCNFFIVAICDLATEGAINVEDYMMKPKQLRTVSAMTQAQALVECARIIGEDESEDAESEAV